MYKIFFAFFILFLPFNLFSQKLSNGFKDFKLGMSKEQVSNLLKKSFDFDAKREEILSIRLEPDTEIITADGMGFIQIGYFHFNKDKLFQIFLKIDEKKIGYYLLLKNNTERFGNPKRLDPKSASWEDGEVLITIEKPCTIKYIYLPIWNELIKKDQTTDNYEQKLRKDFVDTL